MIIKVRNEQSFADHLGLIELHHKISLSTWSSKPSADGDVYLDIDDSFIDKLRAVDAAAADSVVNFK